MKKRIRNIKQQYDEGIEGAEGDNRDWWGILKNISSGIDR